MTHRKLPASIIHEAYCSRITNFLILQLLFVMCFLTLPLNPYTGELCTASYLNFTLSHHHCLSKYLSSSPFVLSHHLWIHNHSLKAHNALQSDVTTANISLPGASRWRVSCQTQDEAPHWRPSHPLFLHVPLLLCWSEIMWVVFFLWIAAVWLHCRFFSIHQEQELDQLRLLLALWVAFEGDGGPGTFIHHSLPLSPSTG